MSTLWTTMLSAVVGGLVAFVGTTWLQRRQERRLVLLDLHNVHLPEIEGLFGRVMEAPTDLALLRQLRDAARLATRRSGLIRGDVFELIEQIYIDSMDYETSISMAAQGRPVFADQPISLSPSEIARRESWHLDQIDSVLEDAMEEIRSHLGPQLRPRALRRRVRFAGRTLTWWIRARRRRMEMRAADRR